MSTQSFRALGVSPEWHPELTAALVSIPEVMPGDTVFWHTDICHAVGDEHAGSEYVPDPGGFAPSLVAHVTTVGEQDDERPLDVPLAAALQPGIRVFDLTNRLSALQRQALAAGCVTMSGNLMQLLTNTLRAALVSAR